MKYLLYIYAMATFVVSRAQDEQLTGMVLEAAAEGDTLPLEGANIYWLNSQLGTMSDAEGRFTMALDPRYTQLVISYVGFQTDTLDITGAQELRHILRPSNSLDEVVVAQKREAVEKTFFSAQNVVTINSAELLKAACCNLSESFETNPAIDVNFSDALTGTKQIQMLGLTSPYLMITQENIPMVRGASQAYGLTFTPGTW